MGITYHIDHLGGVFPAPIGEGLALPRRFRVVVDMPDWPLVSITVTTENGRPMCDRVEFRRREGEPALGPQAMRKVPIGSIVEASVAHIVYKVEVRPDGGVKYSAAMIPDEEDARRARQIARRRKPRTAPEDAQRARELFDAARERGERSPADAVAKQMRYSRATVYRLLDKTKGEHR
jgi:hypothetical protein